MKESITLLPLGLSSCPNDTFMFHALLNGLVDTGGLRYRPVIEDIESLNLLAFERALPVTKLSFNAFMQLREDYALLDAGAAFGFGCGPMVVTRKPLDSLAGATVAIPGIHTTACMLLRAWCKDDVRLVSMRFDQILPAVSRGEIEAGVIIHEGRFVFENYGCQLLQDLGTWWEQQTGLPIPLGCIAVRNDAATLAYRETIERGIRASLRYARRNPAASRDFVRQQANELDDDVIDAHIDLYVNDYSLSLGETGRRVVAELEQRLEVRS